MKTYTKQGFAALWQHWKELVQVLEGYAGELAAAGL
jgi:hypothetical protein